MTLCECEEERAAILEHDAGMTREEAEADAEKWPQYPRCYGCPKSADAIPPA